MIIRTKKVKTNDTKKSSFILRQKKDVNNSMIKPWNRLLINENNQIKETSKPQKSNKRSLK